MAADTSGPGRATAPSSHFKALRDSGRSQTQTYPAARRAAPRGSAPAARLPRSPAPLTAAAAGPARPGRAPPSAPHQVPRGKVGSGRALPAAPQRCAPRQLPPPPHPLSARGQGRTGRRSPPRAPSAGTAPTPPLSRSARRDRPLPAPPAAGAPHLAAGDGSILRSAVGSVPAGLPAGSGSSSSAQRLGDAAGLAGLERGGPGR